MNQPTIFILLLFLQTSFSKKNLWSFERRAWGRVPDQEWMGCERWKTASGARQAGLRHDWTRADVKGGKSLGYLRRTYPEVPMQGCWKKVEWWGRLGLCHRQSGLPANISQDERKQKRFLFPFLFSQNHAKSVVLAPGQRGQSSNKTTTPTTTTRTTTTTTNSDQNMTTTTQSTTRKTTTTTTTTTQAGRKRRQQGPRRQRGQWYEWRPNLATVRNIARAWLSGASIWIKQPSPGSSKHKNLLSSMWYFV